MSEATYLIDTNVISELRKGRRANPGVLDFFDAVGKTNNALLISAITIGELRRGVELIRYRGDTSQAGRLESWLENIVEDYGDNNLETGCCRVGRPGTVPAMPAGEIAAIARQPDRRQPM
jgi:predicted nucleic acid-binding protein